MRQLFACAVIGVTFSISSAQTISTPYAFTTFAGRVASPGTSDGIGADARFDHPWGIAVDANGNVYVADAGSYTVRKITPGGAVSTIAGQPRISGALDGSVAVAQFGTLPARSPTSTVAGPFGLALDSTGNIFVADSFSNTIRLVSSATVSTFAGAANATGFADGSVATARFNLPWGIAMEASGVIYVADTYNHVIRRISTGGGVTTIAGSIGAWGSADGIGAAARFLNPTGIAVDSSGNLYVTDSNNTVRRLSRMTAPNDLWEVTTLAGSPGTFGTTDGTGSAARFGGGPSVSSSGGTTVRLPAATPTPPVNIGVSYSVNDLPGIAVDGTGNVFISDHGNYSIRMITPSGVVTTIAGSTSAGSADGVGATARFVSPMGIALDADGNLYVADSVTHTIRKGAVATAPAIRAQPLNQTAGIGGSVTLTVVAVANPAPAFQWRRDGFQIPGATAATLTLSNIQAAQAGNYSVSVSNLLGTVMSAAANLSVVNTPVFYVQPLSQSVASGQTLTLTAAAGGSPVPTFQWHRDGVPIPGATNTNLVLPNVEAGNAGDYFVVATNSAGVATSSAARVTLNTGRIVNLSIRSPLNGAEPLIVGFVATGGPKPLLIRAVGPTLRNFGVTGAMTDPQLSLQTAGVSSATNDNWGTGSAIGQLTLAANQVGAFALPADSLDSAILATAVNNAMTAHASSRNNAGGIVLIELYDTTPTGPSRLINVSARAKVGGGENALFAGFVVSGNGTKTLLIRAIGPTLGAFGVSGVLADPRLDIFPSGATAPMASNDNWGGNVALAAAFRSVAAFLLPSNDSKDAALLVLLSPGAYSAQVSGVGGLTGEVLLEIYELP